MKKLIVVGDDFGWSESVNLGCLETYKNGFVTELSLMLGFDATDSAIDLINKEKLKDVGLHMVLISKKDNDGKMLRQDDYRKLFMEKTNEEIYDLVKKELDLFEKLVGKKPTHIIPQYGIHGNLKLLEFVIKYAEENNIPVRLPGTALAKSFGENYAAKIMMKRSKVKSVDHLIVKLAIPNFASSLNSEAREYILSELFKVDDGKSAEIVTHPGYFDENLLKSSSLNFERVRDVAIFTDQRFKQEILDMGFEFVSYSEL